MLRTGNPTLRNDIFLKEHDTSSSDTMTIQGTVNKTGLLLLLTILSAAYTWGQFLNQGSSSAVLPWMGLGGIVGFILSLIIIFKKQSAPKLAPAYAVAQGLFLGGLSAQFEMSYPGIVLQAVGLTFGTLFCLLGAYKSGAIKVTENFKLGIAAATGGIMLFYLASFILSFFGVHLNSAFGNSPISILFSVGIVVIAALNLVLDFDFIETGAEQGAPKYMEWYAGFGLLVTLIWLYIEILRLLAKLQSRRD